MDRLRIVTFSVGGRAVEAFNLLDGDGYNAARGSFEFQPPEKKPRMIASSRAYGGSSYHSMAHENGAIKATLLVAGGSEDQVLTRVAALVEEWDAHPDGRFIEWRPDGASYSTYWEIRGPAVYKPRYEWVAFTGAHSMLVDFEWPVAPLGQGDPMDIGDDFSVDSLSDYAADAGSISDLQVTGGALKATANLSAEKRLIHTARGYTYGDIEAVIKFTPGATINGFKAGVIVQRFSADTYIEAYVDDNGTASRLRVDEVVAGVRTNRASTNLGTRISNGTPGWVRIVAYAANGAMMPIAYYYTSEPSPRHAENDVACVIPGSMAGTWTSAQGRAGCSLTPQHADATIDDIEVLPFRFTSSPLYGFGEIPGDAPALVDARFVNAGSPPVFALFAWSDDSDITKPGPLRRWSVGAAASSWDPTPTGFDSVTFLDSTASSAETYAIEFNIDPNECTSDEGTPDQLLIEVWLRVEMRNTLVTPKVVGSIKSTAIGPEVYTIEHGAAGRILTVPSGGGIQLRLIKVGTLPVAFGERGADGRYLTQVVKVQMPLGAGSSGTWGVVEYICFPSASAAMSDSARPLDSYYPVFSRTTGVVVKTVRSDLTTVIGASGIGGVPDHCMGGAPIEIPCGSPLRLGITSTLVPDDPVPGSTSESSGTFDGHLAVTPRYKLFRVD